MRGSRILVVDDDRAHLLHLEKILVKEGFEVIKAVDGLSAMEILSSDPDFDIVLLDRNMPGMNGLELLTRMKLEEALQDIPVVLQTALADAADILEGLRSGARFYLTKPLDAHMLLGVVRAAIEEFNKRRMFWNQLESTTTALGMMKRGRFTFSTLAESQDLASSLALACPEPKRVVVGLSELLINALEHGNLGITYAEKTQLIEAQRWREEVERRQALPAFSWMRVTVDFTRMKDCLRFRITDMGKGFAWQDYMQPNPERLFDSHGRGILLAKWEAFDAITYRDPGNCVTVETRLSITQGK